jgi:dTDP-4-dehydrorhamnose reductase
MPKTLLLGKDGQIGWELARCLSDIGQLVALGRDELDLTELDEVRKRIEAEAADIIVNAAAYTDVDGAERERDLARVVNTDAPRVLAEVAKSQGALFVHYSTDYVFDGDKGSPYTEEDLPEPINHYGQTKLKGEQAIAEIGGAYWIFRTSWVYSRRRSCFVTKVLEWARHQETLQIADDQWGSPTWCRVVADATRRALEVSFARGPEWADSSAGIYNVACSGSPSRLEWAQAILAHDPQHEEQLARGVIGVPSAAFPAPAQRPRYCALDCRQFEATFGLSLPSWEESLVSALRTPG